MRSLFMLLASALLVFMIFFWIGAHFPSEDTPLPSSTFSSRPNFELRPISKARTFPSPQPSRQAHKPDTTPAQHDKKKPVALPDGNLIKYEIKDGLAIAYGDQILGKPDASTPPRGMYEAPDPILWDSPKIPYLISPELPNPERVEQAFEYLRKHTRIQFIPYQGQPDGVIFEPGSEHCLSFLGKIGGIQPIRLSKDCQMTEVLHEIMHTLGFIHEQSRPDRDQYVEVIWDHIDEKYQLQFLMTPSSFMRALKDSPFDYRSVMLYRPDAFSNKLGEPTLKSRTADPVNPIQGGLSEYDIKRIYRLYDL